MIVYSAVLGCVVAYVTHWVVKSLGMEEFAVVFKLCTPVRMDP